MLRFSVSHCAASVQPLAIVYRSSVVASRICLLAPYYLLDKDAKRCIQRLSIDAQSCIQSLANDAQEMHRDLVR